MQNNEQNQENYADEQLGKDSVTQPQRLGEGGAIQPQRHENDYAVRRFGNDRAAAFKNYFTATRISYIAIFTALAYVLYLPYFEFPIIPAVPYLKIDFSNTFVMIAGFALGPVAGMIVGILKELLHSLTFGQTVGIGELANILMMTPFVLLPSILYKKHKGIKSVIISLVLACLLQTAVSVPVNYTLTFPFFLSVSAGKTWAEGMEFYLSVWYWAVLFNFVKTLLISAAVMLLYKPLSRAIKLTNAKFSKNKGRHR